ncbi:MAG TPA: hypothetical protein DEP99_01285, partial [Nitrospiraceae bacterium]|nr:hypothetical protein [Nitrospiraceae bacterium]
MRVVLLEELENLLRDEDVEVRREAVEKLRELEDKALAIMLLIKAIEDPDWRVRKTSVEILLEHRGRAVTKGLIDALYLEDNAGARNSAIEALTKLGAEATDYLIEAFESPNRNVRKFIIDILGDVGDRKALLLILNAIKDEDDNVRVSAVEHLGRIRDASVTDALISILESGDLWLGYPAADALGMIGEPKAINVLLSALLKKPLREPALRALGRIGDISTLPFLTSYLRDPSKVVREETLKALENLFHKGFGERVAAELRDVFKEGVIDVLLPFAVSDRKEIKVAAIILLGLLRDEKAIAPLLEMSSEKEFQEDITKALVFIGTAKPESLIPFFNSDDPYQKRTICDIAGKVRSIVFFTPLIECLKDGDGHVRAMAALSLSEIGDLRAVSYIKPLLLNEYEDVQETAVKSLARLKEGLSIDEVINGLSDKNEVLRKNSATLLGLLKEAEAIGPLGFAMKDSNVSVRMAVVDALGLIGGPDAVNLLLLAITDEVSDIRRAAAIALGKFGGDEVVDSLILLLQDRDDCVRAAAAESLGIIKNEKAIEPLI